jgi:hypothetical protein
MVSLVYMQVNEGLLPANGRGMDEKYLRVYYLVTRDADNNQYGGR